VCARRRDHAGDEPLIRLRVRINAKHPFTARERKPVLQRPHLSDPAARERWFALESDAVIPPCRLLDQRLRRVLRTAIHDDDFHEGRSLAF
jgi:hypothetical protein